jgi:ribA/ribD-fused uncharacterized protein
VTNLVPCVLLAVSAGLGACASRSITAPNSTAEARSCVAAACSVIDEFQGEYRFLSNFWPATITFEGIEYPSVEHAYQAAKTLDPSERRQIAALATPSEAKTAGRALASRGLQRADWEQVKFDVMERCVREKFIRHADLRAKLLATGDAELVEGNDWGDRVWGVSPPPSQGGQGENRLGKILMSVRDELRDRATNGPVPVANP